MQKRRRIKKILLVMPPRNYLKGREGKRAYPPLGLAYLASALENNWEVSILDSILEGFGREEEIEPGLYRYGLSFKQIEKRIRDFGPDVVGVSCLQFIQYEEARIVCNIAKNVDPLIATVMGGACPSISPSISLRDRSVDFLILGEGESALYSLVRSLETGSGLADLPGLAYRDSSGDARINPRAVINRLDSLPLPARHLLSLKEYPRLNRRPFGERDCLEDYFTSLVSSRGCSGDCRFCSSRSLWGQQFRAHSPSRVLREIELLVSAGIRELHFLDDNLTLDKRRAEEIFEGIIGRRLNISWYAISGMAVNTLDTELLMKMRESGCYRVALPIETAKSETLDAMRKPIDHRRIAGLVKTIKAMGMHADGIFMIGYPGETTGDIDKTLEFANSLSLDNVTFCIATPFPGTALYDDCLKKGYIREDMRWLDLRFAKGNIETPEFSPQYLERVRKEAWLRINFPQRTVAAV